MVVRGAKKEDVKAIADIISTAFMEDYRVLKQQKTIAEVFESAILGDRFFVGCVEGAVVAIAAVSDINSRVMKFNRKFLRKKLGFIRNILFKPEVVDLEKNIVKEKDMVNIEFVAVVKDSRGKGYAKTLLEGMLNMLPHRKIILDVKDNNPAAIKTYEKLGFTEYRKKKVSRRSYGCDYLICMELNR